MLDETRLVAEAGKLSHRDRSTFARCFRLLPSSVRGDFHLLYLVCRTLDDLVDFNEPCAGARLAAVEAWCADGEPTTEETWILEALSCRRAVTRELVLQFCQGMRHDLDGKEIETEAELDLYCYRVAGTVGKMLAGILGMIGPDAEEKAAALGMAMQRTNILRDIDEDLANGRVYIPKETIRRFGSLAPLHRTALVRDQVACADALFEQGVSGIKLLRRGRRAISIATRLYRQILREIEREAGRAEPNCELPAPLLPSTTAASAAKVGPPA